MRPLGVGLVYWAALEPLFEAGDTALAVLELEPQTLWEKVCVDGAWRYRSNGALLDRLAALPQAKLLHGVGHPVGGTVADAIDPVPEWRRAVRQLNPVWFSEHLSFNRSLGASAVEHAGFLLPPPQTPAGVRVAADNIDGLRRAIDRPLAFETGVNYLQRRPHEMSDGAFFAAVAEASDSGILLDLHNLWCNERNGRQSVAQALAQLPLDRVWEVHLAGGMQQGRYWLDSHSGAIPAELVDLAAQLMPRLPRLGALVFEILPEHLPGIGLDGTWRQLECLQALWRLRPAEVLALPPRSARPPALTARDRAEVGAWEQALVAAIGAGVDPGCGLYRELIVEFRQASLARAMRYTMTALLKGLGAQDTQELLRRYFEVQPPDPFAALEAEHFAQFLRAHALRFRKLPHFAEVLAFEHALARATVYGESSELSWTADPVRIFEALDAGALPHDLPPQHSRLRIASG